MKMANPWILILKKQTFLREMALKAIDSCHLQKIIQESLFG
jgi:hypothetical protein